MARISTCDACRQGDHKRCRKIIEQAPKGMLGGTVCGCKGQCVNASPEDREQELRLQRIFRKPMRRY